MIFRARIENCQKYRISPFKSSYIYCMTKKVASPVKLVHYVITKKITHTIEKDFEVAIDSFA